MFWLLMNLQMISCLGNYLERRHHAIPDTADIAGFLELLLVVVQSQSLVVSIPVLVTWTRLLHKASGLVLTAANAHLIGPLLELCSSRLIRYENLPEDTQDPTYLLLLEDTDTIPERHAFLGNYRRYSSQVIELIVQLKVSDAIYHILSQSENVLQHLYDGQTPLNSEPFSFALDASNGHSVSNVHLVDSYSKTSMPVLRVDAQFTVIEAALKGFTKWRGLSDSGSQQKVSVSEM